MILLLTSTGCIEVEGSPAELTPVPLTVTTTPFQTVETIPLETATLVTATPEVTATPGTEEASSNETVFIRMVENLEGVGARVRIGERVEQDYFRTAARIFEVEGEKVLVFAFPNERTSQAASNDISEDGRTIAGRDVDFRTAPHFYLQDRFILLTVSQDEELLSLFQQALGEPFAGGEPELQRPEGFVIETGEDLYHAFLYEGAQVEVGKNLQAPLETEEAFYLLVEGEEVQIYQMSTREEAERVAAAISKDGTSIGIFPVPASDTPHFFLVGRVIVFYQGENQELLDLLVEVLGDPITENI